MYVEISRCFDLGMVQDTSSKYYSRKSKDNAAYTGRIRQPQTFVDLSTSKAMSASSGPKSNKYAYRRLKPYSESKRNDSVYRRRKLHKNFVALFQAQKRLSSQSSKCLSVTEHKHDQPYSQLMGEIDVVRAPVMPVEVGGRDLSSKPKSNEYVYRQLKLHSESKRNDSVYRRRKLHKNSVPLFQAQKWLYSHFLSCQSSEYLSESEQKHDQSYSQIKGEIDVVRAPVMPVEVCNRDLLDNGNTSIYIQHCPQNCEDVFSTQINIPRSLEDVSKPDFINECSVREEQKFPVSSISNSNVQKSTLESYSSANDRRSSSISNMDHGSVFFKSDSDDTAECSSSDIVATELFGKRPSKKELSVSTRARASVNIPAINGDACQQCKICGLSENPLKMLICDLCEEAFHLSCCKPRVKEVPIDEWYCQPCMKKKPKPLLGITTEKSSNIMSENSEYRKKTFRGESSLVSFMLKDEEPYTSGVRIGKAFQAEVPDWSDPIPNDTDNFGEALEMDPSEYASLDGWNSNQSCTDNSIGNWLQCREVIYGNIGDDEGIICGKWRRAPLFEVQTDDWDCSCCVLWDPIHSDCDVPQELGTDEVMMHLKYVQSVCLRNPF
ncbi:uncharacterized protein LOC143851013 isoform X2 [Tasmannia lanceolata]|uniref:uncharacterized protein LOC143851013 isoform X2 n=1 Tax=Tasmannia lanceolata TaxID=3420 RepID=UPI004064A9E3